MTDNHDTKELMTVHEQPPPDIQEGEPVSAFTPEQRRELRTIIRDEIRVIVDVTAVENAARRIDTRADQMQTIFANDQLNRGRLEQAYKDVTDEIKGLKQRMNEGDENRQKLSQSFDELREDFGNLRNDVRDGHYRIGDALVPVHGRNPMIPDSSLVTTPLRSELSDIRKMLLDVATLARQSSDKLAQADAEKEARRKWREQALPSAVRGAGSLLSSPFIVNNAIKILGGGALATAFIEVLQSITGVK